MVKRRSRIVTEQQLGLTFSRRAFALGAAEIGVGGLLAARMGWLSIVDHAHYAELAERNRVQATLIPPRRGWIVDRAGKPIAINRTDFRVDLIPDRMTDPARELALLTRLLGLSDDDLDRVREDIAKANGFAPVAVAEKLDWTRYAALSVRQPDLPGVLPSRGYARYYPDGAAVAHLVGYVGSASADQYNAEHDPLLITPGFKVGKDGIEKTQEQWLRGKPGAKREEVTAHGRMVRELTTRTDVPGRTLRLTVDAGLQDYAARRIGDASGSAVVIDVLTGDILAMASMPAYDPNSFSDGISRSEWAMLSNNDHKPLMNKVLQGLYPPGSTFKPVTALAALGGGVSPEETVFCSGKMRFGDHIFHCYKPSGHGTVNLHHALAQSCDIYFYTMGHRVGIDRIASAARKMGLGEKYPLPVVTQSFGTVPDREWKLRKYHRKWIEGETFSCAIGQGYTLANPLQLALMAARIASGRTLDPRLLGHDPVRDGGPLDIPAAHLDIVRAGMYAVVNAGGTGGSARLALPGVSMAGKTGTAQVRRITMAERGHGGVLKDAALPFRLRDHSLFVGFAPYDNPRYAVAVVLEHSGHIVTAAPIGRDVMTYLFAPKQALSTLAALETGWGGNVSDRMARDATEWRRSRGEEPAPPPTLAPGADADKAAGAEAADPEADIE